MGFCIRNRFPHRRLAVAAGAALDLIGLKTSAATLTFTVARKTVFFPGMHHAGWKQSGMSSYDYYGTSYSANSMYIYDPINPTNLFTNSIYLRPLSNVPDPDRTLLHMENAARFAYSSYDPELPNPPDNDCQRFLRGGGWVHSPRLAWAALAFQRQFRRWPRGQC